MTPAEITTLLRRRIVADLHLGKLKPGGRLPSLRDVSRELNVSIRAVARAYGDLQREGLVVVRGRSGIYLVLPQAVDIDLGEPLNWYADMLREAWSRRLSLGALSGLLHELVANPMRCACIESTQDHMIAFCTELEEDFALRTVSVTLTADGAIVDGEVMSLYDALASVDFAVTTAFHAAEVQVVADLLRKPVVVVSVSESLVDALEAELQNGVITIVAQDEAFVDRFQTYLLERFRQAGEMQVLSLTQATDEPSAARGTLLYTRAARQQLKEEEYHLLPPPIPFLSANVARKVVQCMLAAHRNRALQVA